MDPAATPKHTRSMEVPTRKSENQSRARPRTVVRKMKSCEVALSIAPVSTGSTWAHLLSTHSWTKKPKPLQTLPPARPIDPDAMAKQTRSTEVSTGKSENQSRARPRTVVRKMKSCEVALTEAPVSVDSTWAQLLSTYSWTKQTKPLQTLPSRRFALILRPLTARETERERQWANAQESDTRLFGVPLDIVEQIFHFAICTACKASWHDWCCGTCNLIVPRKEHYGSFERDISTTSRFFETRQQIKIRLKLERRWAELNRSHLRPFLNAHTQRSVAAVSPVWFYVLLLVHKNIDYLEKLIDGVPTHINKTSLNILFTAEKYEHTPTST